MKWINFINDYLTFSRRLRIGIFVVASLIALAFIAPRFLSKNPAPPSNPTDTTWITALKKLEIKQSKNQQNSDNDSGNVSFYQYDRTKSTYSNVSYGELFFFDPNSISRQGWEKLGLRDKTINTIQNFIAKGGHFYKKEDLKKIYGLRKEEYERLAPYVQIKTITSFENAEQKENKVVYTFIDINGADTSMLIALPGIGSKLAARIINFRNSLGGFYSIEQIKETYGLPDSTFQKIKSRLNLNKEAIKKININTATIDELKTHPYIKYTLANAIIAYRNEHGPFLKVEDIKKIVVITEETFEKISPYLSIQ